MMLVAHLTLLLGANCRPLASSDQETASISLTPSMFARGRGERALVEDDDGDERPHKKLCTSVAEDAAFFSALLFARQVSLLDIRPFLTDNDAIHVMHSSSATLAFYYAHPYVLKHDVHMCDFQRMTDCLCPQAHLRRPIHIGGIRGYHPHKLIVSTDGAWINSSHILPQSVSLPSTVRRLQFGIGYNSALMPNHIPPTVTAITFMFFSSDRDGAGEFATFNQSFQSSVLPDILTSLNLGWAFVQRVETLPKSLTDLKISAVCLHYDCGMIMPPSLTSLQVFDPPAGRSRLPRLTLLPPSLRLLETSLTILIVGMFDVYGRQPYEVGEIPNSVLTLTATHFNTPLPVASITTSSLTTLTVNCYDHPLEAGSLPLSLTDLYLPAFNQRIDVAALPPRLRRCRFERFNQDVRPNVLPMSLTELRVGDEYTFPVTAAAFHHLTSLTLLELGSSFRHRLEHDCLPANLIELNLGRQYNHTIAERVLPSSLRRLRALYCHFQPKALPDDCEFCVIDEMKCYQDDAIEYYQKYGNHDTDKVYRLDDDGNEVPNAVWCNTLRQRYNTQRENSNLTSDVNHFPHRQESGE